MVSSCLACRCVGIGSRNSDDFKYPSKAVIARDRMFRSLSVGFFESPQMK
jgi:hypothetical protein